MRNTRRTQRRSPQLHLVVEEDDAQSAPVAKSNIAGGGLILANNHRNVRIKCHENWVAGKGGGIISGGLTRLCRHYLIGWSYSGERHRAGMGILTSPQLSTLILEFSKQVKLCGLIGVPGWCHRRGAILECWCALDYCPAA
ncbi:hypothetical protein CHARACLAT_001336 [Characodon lateralis]|uniref:Uncharacterized protein n=1 Tax=Characodon lateralis TaxID=208331 RepID=A0ABU7DYG4_9TELE|nr:hypothetical protein [Characodon lateralis]